MKHLEDMNDFLDTLSESVQRNVVVISSDDLEQNFFLHISKDTNIREFIPAISTRQSDMEDRTVPRVTVAPTLFGCIVGYAAHEYDFLELKSTGEKEELSYKGGYVIYSLPFDLSLKPTNKLVYDSSRSDEHWLVSYNKETATIVPEKAGKMFIRSIKYISKNTNTPDSEITLYVEVTKENGFRFSKKYSLEKGYWVIEVRWNGKEATWLDDSEFTIKEISKAEFLAVKNESAAMLSNVDKVPSYMYF